MSLLNAIKVPVELYCIQCGTNVTAQAHINPLAYSVDYVDYVRKVSAQDPFNEIDFEPVLCSDCACHPLPHIAELPDILPLEVVAFPLHRLSPMPA